MLKFLTLYAKARRNSGLTYVREEVEVFLTVVLSAQAKAGIPISNAMQLQTALARTVRGLPNGHNVGAGFGALDARALFDLLVPNNT